jgi:hypothetical protein
MLPIVRSHALTRSLSVWGAHIGARRVEIAVPSPTRCAAWARKRLRMAAHRLAQVRPEAMCGLAVSHVCRLAQEFHSLKHRSICHRNRYSRATSGAENSVRGKFARSRVFASSRPGTTTTRKRATRRPRTHSTSRSAWHPACSARTRDTRRRVGRARRRPSEAVRLARWNDPGH